MKKTILLLVIILFIIIVTISFILQTLQKLPDSQTTRIPTPINPYRYVGDSNTGQNNTNNKPILTKKPINSVVYSRLKSAAPYRSNDFTFEYDPINDIFVLTKLTDNADEAIIQWAKENDLLLELTDPTMITIMNKKPYNYQSTSVPTAGSQSLFFPTDNPSQKQKDTLTPSPYQVELEIKRIENILLTFLDTSVTGQPLNISHISPTHPFQGSISQNNSQGSYLSYNGLTYYSQCGGSFSSYPLPKGCNLCKAGCGPTTVAMILTSYTGTPLTPPDVVEIYKNNGLGFGCEGSSIQAARSVISQYGLSTTDFIYYNNSSASYFAPDLKSYIDAGWTMMVLASYCKQGCGHFFWAVEVDGNNVMAFDPFYGKNSTPPINENKYSPYPLYRVAFGVKK